MSVFADRLRQLRLDRGEKQSDVSNMLGIAVQSYSAYEGSREPKYEYLCKLAQHYNVTADYLLGLSDFRNPQLQLEETFNQNVANKQNIQTYRAIQAHIAAIVDDIWGNSPEQIRAFQSFINFINTLSEIKRFTYLNGKPVKPDFIMALDGTTKQTALYIRNGRLKFDCIEFNTCEKALYAFLSQYYEILWNNERQHPDLEMGSTQRSPLDTKEEAPDGNG